MPENTGNTPATPSPQRQQRPAINLNTAKATLPATHRTWMVCTIVAYVSLLASLWTNAFGLTDWRPIVASAVILVLTAALSPRN